MATVLDGPAAFERDLVRARRGSVLQRKSPLARIADSLASLGGEAQGCHDDSPAFIVLSERHDRRTSIVTRCPVVG
jgi:hypothetical protein